MEAFEAGLGDLEGVRPKQSRCENCLPEEPELEAELGLGEDGNSEGEAGDEGEVLSQMSEVLKQTSEVLSRTSEVFGNE